MAFTIKASEAQAKPTLTVGDMEEGDTFIFSNDYGDEGSYAFLNDPYFCIMDKNGKVFALSFDLGIYECDYITKDDQVLEVDVFTTVNIKK